MRYIVIAIDPERFTSFLVVRTFANVSQYHIKTALALLLFNVAYIIGRKVVIRHRNYDSTTCDEQIEGDENIHLVVNLIYLVCTGIYAAHMFLNISRLGFGSEQLSTWDNLFNIIGAFCHLIAYTHFGLFCKSGWKKNLILSLIFIVPYSLSSLLLLSKGTIIFELLMLMVITSHYKKIKIRTLVFLFIAFAIVFPVISMARVNVQVPGKYQINIESIISYSRENNIFFYLSDRFAYYDETYYGINNSATLIKEFREESGNPVSALLSGVIPRAIWPDKPMVSSSYSVTYTLCALPEYIKTSLAIGYISEAFAYWGWFGILFFSIFIAKCNNIIEKIKAKENPFEVALYASVGYYIINFMEGGIIAKIIGLISIEICYRIIKFLQNTRVTKY